MSDQQELKGDDKTLIEKTYLLLIPHEGWLTHFTIKPKEHVLIIYRVYQHRRPLAQSVSHDVWYWKEPSFLSRSNGQSKTCY